MSDPAIDPPKIETPKDDTNTWAMFTHLSALCGLVGVPVGHIVGPLVIWLIKKDGSPILDAHGKEALNFQISSYIYGAVAAVLILVLIGLLLLPLVIILNLVFTIIGAMKASQGELYRYPLTIRFIK